MWRLVIPPAIEKTLRKLPPEIKSYVRAALEDLRKDPWIGKPLRDELDGFYSFRARRFRIVYQIVRKQITIIIVAIGHRDRVYQELEGGA